MSLGAGERAGGAGALPVDLARRRSLTSCVLSSALTTLPLLLVTVVLIGPLVWTAMLSFRTNNEINLDPYALPIPPHFENYVEALLPDKTTLEEWAPTIGMSDTDVDDFLLDKGYDNGGFNFLLYFKNSVIVNAGSLALVTVITTMAAYVFARRRFVFPGRGFVFVFIFLSMFFPPQITQLSLFQLTIDYDLYNSLWALILVYPATRIAFTLYILRAFFAQIPTEIEDAARIDGCGDWLCFWRVMLPIAKPAIAATVLLNFVDFWNEFLYALTLVPKPELATIPLASFHWVGEYQLDIGGLAAGLVISMLPMLILYLCLSDHFMRGMTAGAVKG